jgi:Xaa-Pro aminopeptidase
MTTSEYRRRRDRLMTMMTPGSIAVVPSANGQIRNRDTEHPFRQNSDFYYLTGFEEPHSLLVLAPGREHGEVIMFCREHDARAERYDGERLGPERAVQMLGVDDAFPIGDLAEILPGLLEGRERTYVTLGEYPDFDRQLLGWVKNIRSREASGAVPPGEFISLSHLLHDLRLYKSPAEQKLMRRAAEITVGAHIRAMRVAGPGISEARLEADLLHEFMINDARFPAYPSIVAAGKNACIMHYIRNDSIINDGDLVLIDAGCEYQYYASDLTRTFPANGRYRGAQREVYEVVLAAQAEALEVAKPGAPFSAPHDAAVQVMVEGLLALGLLEGEVDELIETEDYLRFCVHKSSHWLGLDVHDVGDYKVGEVWRELEPGMVMTVEPGIYLPDEQDIPVAYRGMGVRIEDDVLITRTGNEVLTAAAPKAIEEIESVMND